MKSIFNFLNTRYFLVQALIFISVSLVNFSDFNKFWAFSFASLISFGLDQIINELKRINQNLEKDKTENSEQ